jgi:hypothetical protein
MQYIFRLLIFLNQPYMFRATTSPILRSTFDYIQLLVQCTDTATDRWRGWDVPPQPCYQSAALSVHCTKSCIYSQKCSWGWANLSPETCRADLKRSINGICCILLVAYIVVLVMHRHTDIKYSCAFVDINNVFSRLIHGMWTIQNRLNAIWKVPCSMF